MNEQDLVYRLRKRAEIRRQIQSRKSVQEGKPDRLADLLEEAANEIETLRNKRVQSVFAQNASARMQSAPRFFNQEEWNALESYEGPVVSGDPKGRVPFNLEADDNE